MFILDRWSVQERLVEGMKDGRIPLKLNCATNTAAMRNALHFFFFFLYYD